MASDLVKTPLPATHTNKDQLGKKKTKQNKKKTPASICGQSHIAHRQTKAHTKSLFHQTLWRPTDWTAACVCIRVKVLWPCATMVSNWVSVYGSRAFCLPLLSACVILADRWGRSGIVGGGRGGADSRLQRETWYTTSKVSHRVSPTHTHTHIQRSKEASGQIFTRKTSTEKRANAVIVHYGYRCLWMA